MGTQRFDRMVTPYAVPPWLIEPISHFRRGAGGTQLTTTPFRICGHSVWRRKTNSVLWGGLLLLTGQFTVFYWLTWFDPESVVPSAV